MLDAFSAAVALGVVVVFALAAVFVRAIDARGFLASVTVGLAIIYGGGISWFLLVAVFFLLGVAFTGYQYAIKKRMGAAQEKGGARNWPNILANGGMPAIFAVAEYFTSDPLYAVLFLGSISTAAADTVATELGLLSKKEPALITRPATRVPRGTSGGVSVLGLAGAVLASMVIGVMALLFGVLPRSILVVPLCAFGGTVGSVADSVLGAAVQRKGYCAVCQRPTESLRHCGEKTVATGGTSFIENNIVNLLAALVGGATSYAFLSAGF